MIITLVVDTFGVNNNGTTISAMRFAKSLAERGHTVRILACGDPDNSGIDPEHGYELFYVPELVIPIVSRVARKHNTLFAKPVKSVLEKAITGADIVHIYQPWPLGWAAERIARKLGIPSIASFHVQPENITYNIGLGWFPLAAHIVYYLLYFIFYRRFSHIHCPSKFIAAQLRCHGYRARLHVISNGVVPDFCPGPAREKSKNNLFRILMIGRLSAEKRQDVLIKAVRKSRYEKRIQLYFAGQGPKEKRLRKMGKKLTNPPVFKHYSQKELIELIRSCDLYVHASDVEIEGISCIEAFSCGLVPVISDSKRSATRQFALGVMNLFRAGDASHLAERIDAWIENPHGLIEMGNMYAQYAKNYSLERSVKKIEKVYKLAGEEPKPSRSYLWKATHRFFSYLFYLFIAVPILFIWTRVVLGVKVVGAKRLRKLYGAITVCNHVHLLDCALIGLAFFPRKLIFPTLKKNVDSFWPGNIVKLLGGVAIPGNMTELKQFFAEMEYLLLKGRIVHFFPEGELKPYDTSLRAFKKGAFYLASQARVPIVPISITFRQPKGIAKLYRRKPTMVVHFGQPILPVAADPQTDLRIRTEITQIQMNDVIANVALGK
ncbi:MAG TPA: glycosyltransferase [Clostridiaceae bacterium]|nr:glycosyltransferase [Clostridiaceae bacterium]